MSRTHIQTVAVQFGHCVPAGIVFFSNFSRWMDESSLAFFMTCGVPPWRELVNTRGIIGTPRGCGSNSTGSIAHRYQARRAAAARSRRRRVHHTRSAQTQDTAK